MLVLMADEEVGESGVGSPFFVEARPDLRPDYIVGEGSGERFTTPSGPVYLLDCGVKATASATLTVHGRAGDASLPEAGIDALTEMSRLLARLDAHRSPVRIPPEIEPVLDALGDPADTPEERLAAARAAHPDLDRVLGALVGTVMHATMLEAPGPANAIADRAVATIECIVLPSTTREELEAELRAALGPGRYELDVVAPRGGLVSSPDTPLRDAIEDFLAEHDPEARLLPALGYGFSDCDVMREAYGSVAYGFIPFRHADPATNLDTKHGPDERIATADLLFQTHAAIAVARAIGRLSER
jgi:acetylornithine deacetylase/succinyl-diaminopimelate desuccinylase-like protein